MTTTELCEQVIVPRTRDRQASYIDLPEFANVSDNSGRPLLGRTTVFISHAWKYLFESTLDVMSAYESNNPGTYFCFDLFINNQNIAATLPRDRWSTTFKESVRHIGAVVVVMSPWSPPIPVTRAWCLWENEVCSLTRRWPLLCKIPEIGSHATEGRGQEQY